MKQKGQHCCHPNQIVAFHSVQITVVTGLVHHHNAVQDVSSKDGSQEFLYFKDEVSGLIVREVSLRYYDNLP